MVNTRIFSNAAQAILRSSHAELYRAPNSSHFADPRQPVHLAKPDVNKQFFHCFVCFEGCGSWIIF